MTTEKQNVYQLISLVAGELANTGISKNQRNMARPWTLAIVSQNEEHISLGVHIRGGSCRIDLTPAQAQELINAITQTLNQETTA